MPMTGSGPLPKALECCCDCYEFTDLFERGDSTNIGSDWQECTGDWEIYNDGILGGTLTDTAGTGIPITYNGIVVLKHMVGNPVGILRTRLASGVDQVGAIYYFYVFYGSVGLPCTGTGDYVVKVTMVSHTGLGGSMSGTIEIVGGTSQFKLLNFDTDAPDMAVNVCVSSTSIEVTTGADVVGVDKWLVIECDIAPTEHWFALGSGGSAQGYWTQVQYEDHYDHNIQCPKCSPSHCFPLSNDVIIGYTIQITSGIGPGIPPCSEACPSSTASYDILIGDNDGSPVTQHGCLDDFGGNMNVPEPNATCHQLWSWSISCSEFGITLFISMYYNSGDEDLIDWSQTFSPGTAAAAIAWVDKLPTNGGTGKKCDFANALITATPIIEDNCCGDTS